MNPSDILHCSDALRPGPDGIFLTDRKNREIHFPVDGLESIVKLEGGSFWFRHRNRCITAAIRAFLMDGPLFDIGGGNGYVSAGLQAAGVDVVLVEPVAAGCARAKARGIRWIINADFHSAGFKPGVLPAVGLFDVLEHMESDGEFLLDLRQAMSPTGLLFITVPAYSWLWSSVDAFSGHFRRYTRQALNRTLRSAGFTPLFLSYFFAPLAPLMLFTRVLPERLAPSPQNARIDTSGEHRDSTAVRLIERLMWFEPQMFSRKRPIPFGASILTVAQTN